MRFFVRCSTPHPEIQSIHFIAPRCYIRLWPVSVIALGLSCYISFSTPSVSTHFHLQLPNSRCKRKKMHIGFICATFLDCVFPKNSHTLSVKRRENRALRHCPLKSPSVSNALYTIPINIFSQLLYNSYQYLFRKSWKGCNGVVAGCYCLVSPVWPERVAPILEECPH